MPNYFILQVSLYEVTVLLHAYYMLIVQMITVWLQVSLQAVVLHSIK